MRIFIDTNIFYSAILFPGSMPDLAITRALQYPNQVYTSFYCINELKRNLIKKVNLSESDLDFVLSAILMQINVVKYTDKETREEYKVADPNDRPVLRAAIKNKCDILITGDKHLLNSGITKPLIIKPAYFCTYF